MVYTNSSLLFFHVSQNSNSFMGKRIFAAACILTRYFAVGDTHIDKKVSVKEVVFDSPVADIVWLEPDNRIVLARTHHGMYNISRCFDAACRPALSQ